MLKLFGELTYYDKFVSVLDEENNLNDIVNELECLKEVKVKTYSSVKSFFDSPCYDDFDLIISNHKIGDHDVRNDIIKRHSTRHKEVPFIFIFDDIIECKDWDQLDSKRFFYDYLERNNINKKLSHRVDLMLRFSNILNMFYQKSEQDLLQLWRSAIARDRIFQAAVRTKFDSLKDKF